jgi:hypothetical protein
MKTTRDLILEGRYSIYPLKYNGLEFYIGKDHLITHLRDCVKSQNDVTVRAECSGRVKNFINEQDSNVRGKLKFQYTDESVIVKYIEIPSTTCDECDGDGRVECYECGQDKDCECCDGTGLMEADKYFDESPVLVLTIPLNQIELFD